MTSKALYFSSLLLCLGLHFQCHLMSLPWFLLLRPHLRFCLWHHLPPFLSFFFDCKWCIWWFLGQGSNPSLRHDLHHRCSNARQGQGLNWYLLLHCNTAGISSSFPLFSFFFSFLASLQCMEFLDQLSGPSHSCDLSHSCGNARTLTHCARPGIEPASQCSQDTADSIAPHWELLMLPTTISPVSPY